jgi:hypothetical protein
VKLGALRISAIALGAAAIALLTPIAPASAAARHHGVAGPAMHRAAWGGGYRHAYASGRHYRSAYGHHAYAHRYAYGWRRHGWRGVAVAGGYYGGSYGGSYYRPSHGCWWYRHYDPYDTPSWCGTYYTPAYDYSSGYDDGPYVGFAYGSGFDGGGYRYGRRYGASMAGIASTPARQAALRAPVWARPGRTSSRKWAERASPGWGVRTSPEGSTAAWAAPTSAAGCASTSPARLASLPLAAARVALPGRAGRGEAKKRSVPKL